MCNLDGDVDDPEITVTAPPKPLYPDPTETFMEPHFPYTDDPVDKLMPPVPPDDAYQVLMATLPLIPIVPALTVFNRIAPELVYVLVLDNIVIPSPKPVFPVPPLTKTSPLDVEPAPYSMADLLR